jgi:hypothetical protein
MASMNSISTFFVDDHPEDAMGSNQTILFVGAGPDNRQAILLLEGAGFQVEVKNAPSFYEAAYGTPVLFALSNRFEGIEGIRVFIENARILGYPAAVRAIAHAV